ncbi:MAG TPA: glycosyl hydrolase family 18 protein [Solirubrobacterales bacterium]|nr:glycosyl hydrolase family 18 protein [Solirubrobacterales bacterium]
MAEIFNGYWLGYQVPNGPTLNKTPSFIDHLTLFVAGPNPDSTLSTDYLCSQFGEDQIKQWVAEVRSRGQKVFLSLMDSETTPWNEVDMSTFGASVEQAISAWGLDGLDIDAESGMAEEMYVPTFIDLADQLSSFLRGMGKPLTYTCYQGCAPGSRDYEILSKIKDQVTFVNLMAYWDDIDSYHDLFLEYANLVGSEKVTFGIKPGKEGAEESTQLKTAALLAKSNPPGGKKAGVMLFATNRDFPELSGQPEWAYSKLIKKALQRR